jgi:hypothetical protein
VHREEFAAGGTGAGRLDTVTSIALGLLQGPLGDLDALVADLDPGRVHHREHRLQPFVLMPDQFIDALIVVAKASHRSGSP